MFWLIETASNNLAFKSQQDFEGLMHIKEEAIKNGVKNIDEIAEFVKNIIINGNIRIYFVEKKSNLNHGIEVDKNNIRHFRWQDKTIIHYEDNKLPQEVITDSIFLN